MQHKAQGCKGKSDFPASPTSETIKGLGARVIPARRRTLTLPKTMPAWIVSTYAPITKFRCVKNEIAQMLFKIATKSAITRRFFLFRPVNCGMNRALADFADLLASM
ncbi:MAG: hypothetical protein ACSHW1_10935 [Yoonia sp.]|uniref:hypothetical protein n=1 Tax=Yoonia sp. TaxID=2212373 RepID=UPI003EF1AA63